MTNQEWVDMLQVIPEEVQNSIVVVLQNGAEVNVDTFFRFEHNYVILRGRVGGTTDDGRAFFVPYDQMLYFRIERATNLSDLRDMLGAPKTAAPAAAVPDEAAQAAPVPVPVPGPSDATATRNALLDRIRAARATQVSQKR